MLSIKGNSIPLEVDQFFSEVIDWLERYSQNPSSHTKLEIDLKYLNGKSLRTLIALLSKLKVMNDAGKEVNVEWSIPPGGDDLFELTEILLSDMKIPHHIKHN